MRSTENTSKAEIKPLPKRDLYYYRRRYVNRVFSKLAAFFAERAEGDGITKSRIARRLDCDPSQVTRWFSQPSNLTLETVSDILLAMDAEADAPNIVKFEDRRISNHIHPLVAKARDESRNAPISNPKTTNERSDDARTPISVDPDIPWQKSIRFEKAPA